MLYALLALIVLTPLVQVFALARGWRQGPWIAVAAALAPFVGAVYAGYEQLVDPEANIRVDLLVIYPTLVVSAVLSLVAVIRAATRRST